LGKVVAMISAAPDTSASKTKGDAWFTRPKLLLWLACFVALGFPTVVIGTSSFYYRDMGLFGYPLAQFYREAFWQGELPLWNPLNNLGLPFFAQWNTLVLYPGSLIYLLLPLPWSMNLFMFAHLFLAAAGMYALAKRWTNSSLGATVAGFAFAWNGLMLHSLMWPNNLAALGWMPWVVLAMERAGREGGRRLYLGALVGAMQMLTGAPEMILLTWLIVGVFWLRDLLNPADVLSSGPRAARRALFLRMMFCGGLVFALCAVQLLPFLDLLRHSQRDASFGGSGWSMPLSGWANFLVPMFGTTPSITGVYSQDSQQWTASYYLGIGTVVLALLVWRVCLPRVKWVLSLTLVGFLLALGDDGHVYALLKKVIPGLGFIRFPIKYVVLMVFLMPLLAAFGVKAWMDIADDKLARARLLRIGTLVLVALAGVIIWAWLRPVGEASPAVVIPNGLFRVASLLALIAGLWLFRSAWAAKLDRRLGRHWLLVGVLLIAGLDMLYHMPPPNPVVQNAAYGPVQFRMSAVPKVGESRAMISPPMDEALAGLAHPDPFTMFQGHRRMLSSSCNLIDGVPKVNGFFSLYLHDANVVTRQLYRSTNYALPLLDFLGVTQISDDAEVFKWHARTSAMPIITAGQGPQFLSQGETLTNLFARNFDPRGTVYLPLETKEAVRDVRPGACRIISTSTKRESVTVEANATAPSLIVIAQAHAPGWRATIDGRPAPLLKANYAFQAVAVPVGTHRIELRYRDRFLVAGAVLSGVALLMCLAGVIWSRKAA
jgi:hypothetical protein